MSPLRLMPKDERFFELFIADGENLLAAARELEALVTSYDRVEERVDAIRALEHQGDEIGDDLTDKIERAFITPFDRGDIHELAARLDDVVDGIQEIAETLPDAISVLKDLLQKLESMKGMDESLKAIHTLENQADGMSRSAIAGLFRDQPDAVEIIKWRDLYTYLENTIDAAEDAGEIIERMVHKAT